MEQTENLPSRPFNNSPVKLLPEAREAAWNGQHNRAINLCTQALASDQLSFAERLDFLDTRAESTIALGQIERAAEDADMMLEIAQGEADPAYLAQALNRLALVQMREGDLEKAIASAAAALQAAQESGQTALLALSSFRLSEAQGRAGDIDAAIELAERAIALYAEGWAAQARVEDELAREQVRSKAHRRMAVEMERQLAAQGWYVPFGPVCMVIVRRSSDEASRNRC